MSNVSVFSFFFRSLPLRLHSPLPTPPSQWLATLPICFSPIFLLFAILILPLWPWKCRPQARKTFEKLFFFSSRPAFLSTWTVKVETKDVQQKALKSACEPDLAPLFFFFFYNLQKSNSYLNA